MHFLRVPQVRNIHNVIGCLTNGYKIHNQPKTDLIQSFHQSETLKQFLDPSSIPESYDSISRHHMSSGQRVLAMGYRNLGQKVSISAWKKRGGRRSSPI